MLPRRVPLSARTRFEHDSGRIPVRHSGFREPFHDQGVASPMSHECERRRIPTQCGDVYRAGRSYCSRHRFDMSTQLRHPEQPDWRYLSKAEAARVHAIMPSPLARESIYRLARSCRTPVRLLRCLTDAARKSEGNKNKWAVSKSQVTGIRLTVTFLVSSCFHSPVAASMMTGIRPPSTSSTTMPPRTFVPTSTV